MARSTKMANAGSSDSSLTETSHTMSAHPSIATKSSTSAGIPSGQTPSMAALSQALDTAHSHAFLLPNEATLNQTLGALKGAIDLFAGTLGDEQLERQNEQRKKRKRGDREHGEEEVLKIRKLYTEGFAVEQVWEQATRVMDVLIEDVKNACEELEENDSQSEDEAAEGGVELLRFGKDGFEEASSDESMDEHDDDPLGASELEDADQFGDPEDDMDSEDDGENAEGFNGFDGEEDFEDEDGSDDEDSGEVFAEDPNGLNDGFFSIDDFNKQTEFLERQDAAADPYTGEASDEEDVDWDMDPTSLPMPVTKGSEQSSRRAAAMEIDEDEEEDSESDEEDGPTFGSMDLNAPEGDSEDEDDAEDEEEDPDDEGDNTNAILYKDFFEPPPRKVGKSELQANYLERQARKTKPAEPEDEEAVLERSHAAVSRDLFDDESDHQDSDDALSDLDPADPRSRKSAHERRQAKIGEAIRKLEAASVAKREWVLSGEARASDRPMDSLIEEQMEFEHTGKTAPELTAEDNEDIEEIIKRRILAKVTDTIRRRRPDDLNNPTNSRRGAYELDDSKPKQSLAEMYEEEHVKLNNPDSYISKADEKLRKDEKEIEALWLDVNAKLDALSSWHYKPKPAAPSLTVVADVATVAMEDAQPTTAAGVSGGESMLAPQEIYKAGKEKDAIAKGEVVPKSGAPIAREEMSQDEKKRRRRREKERIKKRGGEELNQRPQSKKTQQKKETIGELKKGGVKVIDRKGNVVDVDGNKVEAAAAPNGAGRFKL